VEIRFTLSQIFQLEFWWISLSLDFWRCYQNRSLQYSLRWFPKDESFFGCVFRKVVSILPPIFWQERLGWNYSAGSRTFCLAAWCNSN